MTSEQYFERLARALLVVMVGFLVSMVIVHVGLWIWSWS
jgi:hypothetical protein